MLFYLCFYSILFIFFIVVSAWAEDMGQYLFYLDLDIRKIAGRIPIKNY